MIAIDHGNGVLTYYGHCSSLKTSVGKTVYQGQVIAAVALFVNENRILTSFSRISILSSIILQTLNQP